MLNQIQEAFGERARQNSGGDEALGEGNASSKPEDVVQAKRWKVYLMVDPRGSQKGEP
jgi:hypothetical protein